MKIAQYTLVTVVSLAFVTFCITVSIAALHFNGELGYVDQGVKIGTMLFHQYGGFITGM
jgi:hypothetical protein